MIAQIVRTVQKASCGDIKNLKRSGAVCEPLPVKRTAKKYKVFNGVQITGLANLAGGTMRGVQIEIGRAHV